MGSVQHCFWCHGSAPCPKHDHCIACSVDAQNMESQHLSEQVEAWLKVETE